jgi:hypothetical protein
MADTSIVCTPLRLYVTARASRSYSPGGEIDHLLDATLELTPIDIILGQQGHTLSTSITNCQITISIVPSAIMSPGLSHSTCEIPIVLTLRLSQFTVATVTFGHVPGVTPAYGSLPRDNSRGNWVKWTKVGRLDFTIDESNVAGERPLNFPGYAYQLLKLGSSIIAYCTDGVAVLKPVGVHWGVEIIRKVGIACKTAVVGNESEHFFVDTFNKLFMLSDGELKLLDYSEYLSLLNDPVLILDNDNRLVYISDASKGFIYSVASNSFGEGPAGLTGLGTVGGINYVASPIPIFTPKFNICTDIYDFGSRNTKTIRQIELGTDLTYELEVMVESRVSNRDNFFESRWVPVNTKGVATIPCYGVEFRFNIRSKIYEYLELDYIKIDGTIHGFDFHNRIE